MSASDSVGLSPREGKTLQWIPSTYPGLGIMVRTECRWVRVMSDDPDFRSTGGMLRPTPFFPVPSAPY